jgi:hypothetical protein
MCFLARDCSSECPDLPKISLSVDQSPHPRSCYPDPTVVFARPSLTSLATQTALAPLGALVHFATGGYAVVGANGAAPGRPKKTKPFAPILVVQSSSDGSDARITLRVDRGAKAVDPRPSG